MSEQIAPWPLFSLGDLCRTTSGGTPSRKRQDYFEGSIPWVKSGELSDGLVSEVGEFITEDAVSNSSAKLFPAGTLLIAMYGATVGKLGVLAKPAATNQAVCAIFPPPELDSKFLFWFFRYKRNYLIDQAVGGAQPNISQTILRELVVPVPPIEVQREIVAEIEKQFSRLDDAVANLQRVKANLKRYERATIASLTNPETFDACFSGSISDAAISLDNMRKPVNKLERAKRPGNIPYLGANGQTGWIDAPLFDEELVLVVEDETFVGRTEPFCYYFAAPCWVNNHTHVLRARPDVVSAKYLNLALSYYPFIPLTTGSTGRRKLTKAALMTAPIFLPSLTKQAQVIDEVERCLSIAREVEAEVDTNLKRAHALRQASLAAAFAPDKTDGPTP